MIPTTFTGHRLKEIVSKQPSISYDDLALLQCSTPLSMETTHMQAYNIPALPLVKNKQIAA